MAERFFNRELSWLEFNARVLEQACSIDVPLFERLKFLGIVTSNFDEFFMVRVAGLKHKIVLNQYDTDLAGLTPKEQLAKIAERSHEIVRKQHAVFENDILPALAQNGIRYLPITQYTIEQSAYIEHLFNREIFPLLTPLQADIEGHFPHIANLRLHVAFLLKQKFVISDIAKNVLIPEITQLDGSVQEIEHHIAIVQIPTSIKRIVWLPDSQGMKSFALLDDIVQMYGNTLFPGYEVIENVLFKLTRDADFAVDEERDGDFIAAMEEVLVSRQSSMPVRLMCNSTSSTILQFLTDKLQLLPQDIYKVDGPIDITTLTDITNIDGYPELKYPSWKNFWNPDFPKDEPFWDTLRRTDLFLNFPYHSYDPVVRFIDDAADDPDVLAIKMTLYRTSGNSPMVRALERAARNGKQVTAFVELKARFDEKQNISWATQLENAGVIVVHGIALIKVHAKMLLVVRRETEGIKRYVYMSTGNFNDKTARFYGDMSLFTANEEIGTDATLFFNMISGYSAIQSLKRLVMAPFSIKSRLLAMIDREMQSSNEDTPGLIMVKVNSLADQDIIKALYNASNAGVRILLNVRGICMLVPGVENQSENIAVISIVDRFLEHARVFYFQNGGDDELFLASADLMSRNLDRRVELMFPVLQKELFDRIKETLVVYFSDNSKSSYLQNDGKWIRRECEKNEHIFRAQEVLYTEAKKQFEAHEKEIPREFIVRRNDG